jgi:hypothetical protein
MKIEQMEKIIDQCYEKWNPDYQPARVLIEDVKRQLRNALEHHYCARNPEQRTKEDCKYHKCEI